MFIAANAGLRRSRVRIDLADEFERVLPRHSFHSWRAFRFAAKSRSVYEDSSGSGAMFLLAAVVLLRSSIPAFQSFVSVPSGI